MSDFADLWYAADQDDADLGAAMRAGTGFGVEGASPIVAGEWDWMGAAGNVFSGIQSGLNSYFKVKSDIGLRRYQSERLGVQRDVELARLNGQLKYTQLAAQNPVRYGDLFAPGGAASGGGLQQIIMLGVIAFGIKYLVSK